MAHDILEHDPETMQRRGIEAVLPVLTGATVWSLAFAVLTRSLAPDISLADNPELVASALGLSVGHPPGCPPASLMGSLVMCLPVGSPAFRFGLMAAALGGATVLGLWVLLTREEVVRAGGWTWHGAALIAAAAWLFSPSFWWMTATGEKYGLFMASLVWSVVGMREFLRTPGRRILAASALLCGVTLSSHYMGLYLLPLMVWMLWRARSTQARLLAVFFLMLPLGLLILFPAIRADASLETSWAVPDRLTSLVNYLLAREHWGKLQGMDGISPLFLGRAVRDLGTLPVSELDCLLVLAPVGLWFLWRRDRSCAIGALAVLAMNVALASLYAVPLRSLHYFPFVWVTAGLCALGLGWAAGYSRAILVLGTVLLTLAIGRNSATVMQNRNYTAPDHLHNLLAGVEPGGLIVGWTAVDWFTPQWYAQAAGFGPEGFRVLLGPVLSGTGGGRRVTQRVLGNDAASVLDRYQNGPALYWRLAEVSRPNHVYYNVVDGGYGFPSRGSECRGLVMRLTNPRDPLSLDPRGARLLLNLELRSLIGPNVEGPASLRFLHRSHLKAYYSRAMMIAGSLALARGDASSAAALARLALKVGPDGAGIRELLGRACATLDRGKEAELEFQLSLEMGEPMHVEPYIGLASLAREEGKREKELVFLRGGAAMGGGVSNQAFLRAYESESRGGFADAKRGYDRIIAEALISRGRALFQSGRLSEAERSWKQALETDGSVAQALQDLGTLAMAEERFQDALALYREAGAANLGLPELEEDLARARDAIDSQSRLSRLESIALSSPCASTLCDLGNAYWYMGRSAVAARFYGKALELDPAYARGWGNLGSALVREGKKDEGRSSYERALACDPEYTEAMVNLASLLAGEGELRKARTWIMRALELKPDDKEALRMLSRLEEAGAGRQ